MKRNKKKPVTILDAAPSTTDDTVLVNLLNHLTTNLYHLIEQEINACLHNFARKFNSGEHPQDDRYAGSAFEALQQHQQQFLVTCWEKKQRRLEFILATRHPTLKNNQLQAIDHHLTPLLLHRKELTKVQNEFVSAYQALLPTQNIHDKHSEIRVLIIQAVEGVHFPVLAESANQHAVNFPYDTLINHPSLLRPIRTDLVHELLVKSAQEVIANIPAHLPTPGECSSKQIKILVSLSAEAATNKQARHLPSPSITRQYLLEEWNILKEMLALYAAIQPFCKKINSRIKEFECPTLNSNKSLLQEFENEYNEHFDIALRFYNELSFNNNGRNNPMQLSSEALVNTGLRPLRELEKLKQKHAANFENEAAEITAKLAFTEAKLISVQNIIASLNSQLCEYTEQLFELKSRIDSLDAGCYEGIRPKLEANCHETVTIVNRLSKEIRLILGGKRMEALKIAKELQAVIAQDLTEQSTYPTRRMYDLLQALNEILEGKTTRSEKSIAMQMADINQAAENIEKNPQTSQYLKALNAVFSRSETTEDELPQKIACIAREMHHILHQTSKEIRLANQSFLAGISNLTPNHINLDYPDQIITKETFEHFYPPASPGTDGAPTAEAAQKKEEDRKNSEAYRAVLELATNLRSIQSKLPSINNTLLKQDKRYQILDELINVLEDHMTNYVKTGIKEDAFIRNVFDCLEQKLLTEKKLKKLSDSQSSWLYNVFRSAINAFIEWWTDYRNDTYPAHFRLRFLASSVEKNTARQANASCRKLQAIFTKPPESRKTSQVKQEKPSSRPTSRAY